MRALAFAINRKGPTYCGPHTLEETADILSRACGHWGTGAEYLMHTVAHLEDLGIHDRYLWRLQELVADAHQSGGERQRTADRRQLTSITPRFSASAWHARDGGRAARSRGGGRPHRTPA